MNFKKGLFFLAFCLFCVLPISVSAGVGKLEFLGKDTFSNQTFYLDIYANITEENLVTLGADISTDGECIQLDFIEALDTYVSANKNRIMFMSMDGKNGYFPVARVHLKANSICSGTVQINKNASLTFSDNETLRTDEIIKNIHIIEPVVEEKQIIKTDTSVQNTLKNVETEEVAIEVKKEEPIQEVVEVKETLQNENKQELNVSTPIEEVVEENNEIANIIENQDLAIKIITLADGNIEIYFYEENEKEKSYVMTSSLFGAFTVFTFSNRKKRI